MTCAGKEMAVSFNLWNAKFFANLQGDLEQVKQEQVDNLPPLGDSVPPRAVVVGVVPDYLKAILVVAKLVGDTNYDYMNIFSIALQSEFPALADKVIIGYGPKFEVYYELDVDIDISAFEDVPNSIIGFSGLTAVGARLPMSY